MATCAGPLATKNCELRQARKGATAAVASSAGVWLVRVATLLVQCRVSRSQEFSRKSTRMMSRQ